MSRLDERMSRFDERMSPAARRASPSFAIVHPPAPHFHLSSSIRRSSCATSPSSVRESRDSLRRTGCGAPVLPSGAKDPDSPRLAVLRMARVGARDERRGDVLRPEVDHGAGAQDGGGHRRCLERAGIAFRRNGLHRHPTSARSRRPARRSARSERGTAA